MFPENFFLTMTKNKDIIVKNILVNSRINGEEIKLNQAISNIEEIELVYFVVRNVTGTIFAPTPGGDPAFPHTLYFSVGLNNDTGNQNSVVSMNDGTADSFKIVSSDRTLLHFDVMSGWNFFLGGRVEYGGYQKKDMRWKAEKIQNLTNMRITLYNQQNEIFPIYDNGAYGQFVFKVKYHGFTSLPYSQQNAISDSYFNTMNS